MLIISKPLSAGQAQTYHREEFSNAQENYYSEGDSIRGEWQGQLAVLWGLEGEVSEQQFARLTEGQSPTTGEQLVRHQTARSYQNSKGETIRSMEHRAGWDATFSAPKSVSITALVGGDKRIIESHRESVRIALYELERFVQARIGGNAPAQTSGKFVVAKFEHDSSRPVDGYSAPQLHTHAVLFNVTFDKEGVARSIQPRELYKTQQYATAVYRSELASRLQELGYAIERGIHGQPEIKGYTEEYLQASSPRSQQIAKHLSDRGLSGAEAAHIAAQSTREAKLHISKEEVKTQHLQAASGFGDQHLDVICHARDADLRVSSPDHTQKAASASVGFAVDRSIEHEALVDQRTLLTAALRHSMGETRLEDIREEFLGRVEDGSLIAINQSPDIPALTLTTPAMLALERDLIQTMQSGRNTCKEIAPEAIREQIFLSHAILSESQRSAVNSLLVCQDKVQALEGLAGTGKTTSLAAVREAAERSGYAPHGLTPTSRSAQKLAESGIETETIQRFLQKSSMAESAQNRLFVVDESSMVSTLQMHNLFQKLGQNDRVVLVGDTHQREAVDAGRPYALLQEAGMSTAHLNEIIRQKNPALKSAVELLAAGKIHEAVDSLNAQGRVREILNREERIEAIASEYIQNPRGTLVVSPDNASRQEINGHIRQRMQEAGAVSSQEYTATVLHARQNMTNTDRMWAPSYAVGDTLRFTKGSKAIGFHVGEYVKVSEADSERNLLTVQRKSGEKITYSPKHLHGVTAFQEQEKKFAAGDRVQITLPYYPEKLANRELATLQEIDKDGNLRLVMDSGKEVAFNIRQHPHLDHGYAVTSHSSQGETVDRVLVHIDANQACRGLINTRLAYVAISRAREDAIIFTNDAASLGQELSRDISHQSVLKPTEMNLEQELAFAPEQKIANARGLSVR